jgi:FkbM family methyltransferase
MRGSDACLKWSFRDLQNLEVAVSHCALKRSCVQAGGNLGLFPKRLSEDFKRVFTFEPDPKLFTYCKHNAPEENIVHVCAALGKSYEPVALSGKRRDTSGRAAHEGLTHVTGPGKIPQTTIDDLVIYDCDLIYLDIEGYELNALEGAVRTIDRSSPVIAVEVNGTGEHYGVKNEMLREWLHMRGYRMVSRLNSDEVYVAK